MKRHCHNCGTELVPGENWTLSRQKGGNYICRSCRSISAKVYREANPEKETARHKQYYEAHKEQIAVRMKHWRELHKEQIAARKRRYYETNKERLTAQHRRWYEANPEKVAAIRKRWRRIDPERARAAWRRDAYKRRAGFAQMSFEPVDRETIFERDGHCCVYCGGTENLTLDHIVPLARGGAHSEENLVTACRHCNNSKGTKCVMIWLTQRRPSFRGNS